MASMAFGGTKQKCQACQKTVYLVDQLAADGRIYHRACFRCHHCNGTLKFSNYSSIDGALYCKPHYDQLFKMTGRLDKSFEGSPKPTKTDRSNGQMVGANSRYASVFLGTQDKCSECKKTVYPIEKVAVNGNSYHRPCFRCSHGGCTISPANFVAHEGRLYCKHHHAQLFMTKGNFSSFSKVEEKPEEIKVVPPDKLGAEAVQVDVNKENQVSCV
ncbi:LIM domain-containing protein WLIM1-like [Zingiber officinale]|uniref:LIM domain-containing protein WLIM1-like n=1 Tax=Zingiber officinale TaxID=94328 RepID=UPI001C4BFF1F|nr:LIM domain-containing protein WLIM1-like [Zingiber officinale]